MRMKALHTIDRGKDLIAPGQEFTPSSAAEGEMLTKTDPQAAVWIVEPKEPEKDKKPTKLLAADAIAAIGACKTIDQVKEFFKDEERPTVIDAARAKIKAIKDAEKAAADKK